MINYVKIRNTQQLHKCLVKFSTSLWFKLLNFIVLYEISYVSRKLFPFICKQTELLKLVKRQAKHIWRCPVSFALRVGGIIVLHFFRNDRNRMLKYKNWWRKTYDHKKSIDWQIWLTKHIYIICHNNPSIRIIDLVPHHLCCVC